MADSFLVWLLNLDAALSTAATLILLPLSVYVFWNGVDDLFLDMFALYHSFRPARNPPEAPVEKRTAIMIPLWQEHQVIGRMLRHNLAVIRYSNYELFAGVYPNDHRTSTAVAELEREFPRVHRCEVPHDGPTVKADCLNWIYQQILLHEEREGIRFDTVVVHDAEDLIHADALTSINRWLEEADMVQLPVLPLATPLHNMTHGLYCDDFAEGQATHLEARVAMGAFLPGCGVGTGFRREALELLAQEDRNRIFNPLSLTEDYENGLRIHQLGLRQRFIPLQRKDGQPVATREYFPKSARDAIRQRTRWIIGNSLQAWKTHGWGVKGNRTKANLYFLWRDRKGLWGHPLSLLCTAILIVAMLSLLRAVVVGDTWQFAAVMPQGALPRFFYWSNALLYCQRTALRMMTVARCYGVSFSLLVAFRMIWGNWINCCAAVMAVLRFRQAIRLNQPLAWTKTEHVFPGRGALAAFRRRIGEILVQSGYVAHEDLQSALDTRPPDMRLGDYLVLLGLLEETELYEALSLQNNLPAARIDPHQVPLESSRALPAKLAASRKLIPFQIAGGRLHVASPEVPTDELQRELERLTRLEIDFHLITTENFRQLAAAFFPDRARRS